MKTPTRLLAAILISSLAAAASAQVLEGAATDGAALIGAARGQRAGAAAGVAAEKAAAAAAAAPRKVDLKSQFPDPATRNQGNVGSCHAFGSIAVIEAAYYRKNGVHLQLSEDDLYLQRTVLSGDVYDDFCASGKCEFSEGGSASGDIQYALGHGVLSGNSYQSFVTRYLQYRSAEQKTMQGIQKMRDEQSWLEKLLYDPREHWKELSTNPQSKQLLSNYLEGRERNSSAERARVKAQLAGFTLRSKSYDFIGGADATKLSAAQCLAKGAAQRADISAELGGGRPVAIAMSLSGLAAWGQTDKSKHANHAFVLTGYTDAGGKRTFQSRNSWGGSNPDVSEDELCRVYSVNTVLAPGERAAY